MKRCPQCEFVYEDDTNACDMDGSALVHCSQTLPPPEQVAAATESTGPPPAWQWSQWRSVAVPTIAGVVLAAVLFAAYYALVHRSPTSKRTQSTADATAVAQAAARDLAAVPSPSLPDTSASEQSLSNELTASSSPEKSLAPARLNSGPVSAAGGTGRGPVIIRLADGRSIKADEAWETKEGIWYRQAGVVTFLKRGQARAIERGIERPMPARSAAAKPGAKKPKPETPNANKESRIGSILKKTGRILKRPFKL